MPTKIQEVVTAQKLVRKFALVGAFTPQLDETIVPVVLVDSLVELSPDEAPCMGGAIRAAVFGEFSHIVLVNPAASEILVKLDTIIIHCPTTQVLQLRSGATGGTTVNPNYRDSRLWVLGGIAQVPISRVMHHTNVAALGTLRLTPLFVFSTDVEVYEPGIILEPGDDIAVVCTATNAALDVSFLYRQTSLSA